MGLVIVATNVPAKGRSYPPLVNISVCMGVPWLGESLPCCPRGEGHAVATVRRLRMGLGYAAPRWWHTHCSIYRLPLEAVGGSAAELNQGIFGALH